MLTRRVSALVSLCLVFSQSAANGQRISRPNSPDVVELADTASVSRAVKTAAQGGNRSVVLVAFNREAGVEIGRGLAAFGGYPVVFVAVAMGRLDVQEQGARLGLPKPYYLLTEDAVLPGLNSEPTFYVFSPDGVHQQAYRGDNWWRFESDRAASGESLAGALDQRGAIEATRFWASRAGSLIGSEAVIRDIRLAQVAWQERRLSQSPGPVQAGDPIVVTDLEAFLVHPDGKLRIPVRLSGSYDGGALSVRKLIAR